MRCDAKCVCALFLSAFSLVLQDRPAEAAITIAATVSADQGSASVSSVTVSGLSTGGTSRLLLAFIAADDVSAGNTVTGVSGGGLTWQLVVRSNAQRGTAEIWRAFASAQLTNQSITATLAQRSAASLTVVALAGVDVSGTNGSGAIGATRATSGSSGAPTATLTTTRANSWVFGVGDDWDHAIARTVGSGQTMMHQYLAPVGDTYWSQRMTAPTPASGTSVTINDTAPTTDRYNLSVCEVLAAPTGSDTTPPVVSMTAPGSGATVSGTAVTVSASASDAVGVVGVQFTLDGANLGAEDTSSPYSVTWNTTTASNTTHTLAARARDAAGNTTTATAVTVTVSNTDNTLPTIAMTAPGNGTTVSGNNVTVSANASDNVGVVGVQFKLDGGNLGAEDTASPYAISWNTLSVSNGSHTLTATARDAANNVRTATAVSVTVSNADTIAPLVSMTAPADGTTVSGNNVTVSASASDNVGVVGVQFLIDGVATGPEDKTAPYSVSWNTTATGNGPHSLAATARDAGGNSTTSASVGVTVNNPLAVTTNPVSGNTGSPVNFTASASGGNPPYTYSWTFGDGGTGSGASPSHTYLADGTFTVTATVLDSLNATANGSATATITTSNSNVVFFDDFTGSTLSSEWSVISRHGEYQQNETECNVPQQVSVAGGNLTITTSAQAATCGDFNVDGSVRHAPASWPYITGDVQWKTRSFQYGTIEVRAKLPDKATRLWPAIWLLGSNCQNTNKFTADTGYSTCAAIGADSYDEVDIVECDLQSWCHIALLDKSNTWAMCTFSPDTSFHTYTLTWTATSLALAIDGHPSGCGWDSSHRIPHAPMFLMLQTQTGGVGGEPNNAMLPAGFVIDYVKVTQP